MHLEEMARLERPALLVEDGTAVAASPPLQALLQIGRAAELEARFAIYCPERGQLAGDLLPWVRAGASEPVDERLLFVEQASGRRVWLRCTRPASGDGVFALDDDSLHGPVIELSRLAAAVGSLLINADDARSAAVAILQRIRNTIGADCACLFGEDGARLVPYANAGMPTESAIQLADLLLPDGELFAGLRARTCFFLDELATRAPTPWTRWLLERGMGAFAAIPLDVGEGTVGVFCLGMRSPQGLLPAEREVLATLCTTWAAAMRRSQAGEVDRRVRTGMRALSEAAVARRSELPLRDLLRLLVEQVCALTRARYGALGVLNREHTDLEDFIVVGISDEQAARIGHLPMGKGLLGAVIHEARTIRVGNIRHDPRSYGFPANHPPMKTFLGSPLRIGQEVFGNFYLTDKEGGVEFTEEDARLLEAFSAQASLTVSYARETGEQRRLLDAILRHAPHGILFFSPDRQVVFGNSAAERMLGLTPLEATAPQRPEPRRYDLQHPDGRVMEERELPANRALRGEVVANQEVRIVRAGERRVPAFVSAAPVWSETGALLGAVVVFQDISAFKELERLREEFAAVVAHDLRNPLQAMMMQIESLLRRSRSDTAQVPVATLQRMQKSGQRLTHLISDLLDASRIEGGRLNLDRHPVTPGEAVAGLLRQIEMTLGNHPVNLVVEPGVPTVAADPLRLDQVLTNLLENAAKYSGDGSPINVRVERSGDGGLISIADRGPGIAPEDMPRLFDRYYQTKRARAKRSGLGLGLYITKGLVEAHGGRLWAESTVGVGSTFYLWLPAVEVMTSGLGEAAPRVQ